MKRRFLVLLFMLALFVPIAGSIYRPQQASAAPSGTGNNLLQLVAEHCHDLDSIKHDFSIGSNVSNGKGACHEDQGTATQGGVGWEEVLVNSLGCSSNMFYQHDFTNPNDDSVVTKTLWYTYLGAYKDCYLKAQTMFNNMTSTGPDAQCGLVVEGSDNYENCLADVNNLHAALGCSTDMITDTGRKDADGNEYWKIDPNSGAVKNCLQRIDDVGKQKIVIFGADGKTTLSKEISDPSITPQSSSGPGADNHGGTNGDDNSCEASGGGFSLNWALCEVYQGTQSVVNWMFSSVIEPLLVTTPICLPGNASCNDTIYTIWSHFRVYGDIFLVITLLVIVFGESIGGGMIEAYTAKKVLPRLLAAAILLNLSIYIMAFMVDMTNIIGGGIGQLLTGPLNGQGLFTIHPGNITAGAIFVGAGGVALLAGFTAVSVTGIALLAVGLAITGLIAVMAVFFTLIIRQAIIIGLVLVSPVAFALWCLPNTERWFKRWWDTFFQMLLVYPMVVVLFSVADIMSYLTAHNGNGGSFANNVVAFMLLLIPLYLVPFTLRSSNRLMGAIQGAASNVGRQINAVSGRRAFGAAAKNMGETWENSNTNRRFNPNRKYIGGVNKRLNSAISSITSPGAAAKIYGGIGLRKLGVESSMGKGILNQIDEQKFQHTQKLGERLNQLGFNDRALRGLMEMDDYSAGAIRQKAAELKASGNPNDRLAGNQLDSSATFLAQSLYSDPEMGRADIGMAAGLAVTAQGFSNSDEVADLANKRGGQGSGLAAAFVTQAQLAGQRAGMLDMKAGYGIQVGEDGNFTGTGVRPGMSAEARDRAIAHQIKRIQTTGQSEIQAAKGGSVTAMAPGFRQILSAAKGPANADGKYEFHYQNEQGQGESVEISPQEVQRVAAMLGTAQAAYGGGAASTSEAIQQIINQSDMSGDTLSAYQSGRRDNVDPARNPVEPPASEDEEN